MHSLVREIDIPPSWLALHIGAAWVLALVSPAVFGGFGQVLGPVLLALGAAIMAAAVGQMALARTTVIPRRNPSALVTGGLFAWSRNPIYLADVAVLLAAIFWWDVPLALPLVPVFMLLLRERFIRDEEARLRTAFGGSFDEWSSRVRRWL